MEQAIVQIDAGAVVALAGAPRSLRGLDQIGWAIAGSILLFAGMT